MIVTEATGGKIQTCPAGIRKPSGLSCQICYSERGFGEAQGEFAMMFPAGEQLAPMETPPMKAIELIGDIDAEHRLQARVPEDLPAGPVRLIVLLPDEDETGAAWTDGVAQAWADELGDARQDIYTLEDGQPMNATR